jgi:uncharacterized protein
LYWSPDQPAANVKTFWEDSLRYLYLPRLKDRSVLGQAIQTGAASRDFFGTAYGQHDGKFDGFQLGTGIIQFDDTLLLIEPEAAAQYEASQPKPAPPPSAVPNRPPVNRPDGQPPVQPIPDEWPKPPQPKVRAFHVAAEVAPATAKVRMGRDRGRNRRSPVIQSGRYCQGRSRDLG